MATTLPLQDLSPGKPGVWRGIFWILAAAGLFFCCAPGRPLPHLAWAAMAPLFIGLSGKRPVAAACLGLAFGWLIFITNTWWLHAPLHDILGMSLPAAVLLIAAGCVLFALPYGLAGFVIALFPRSAGIPGAARDAAVFTAALYWLTPVFPGNPAHTQYEVPNAIQIVELGGTALLLFALLWVNCLLGESVVMFRRGVGKAWRPLGAAGLVMAIVFGFGAARLWQLDRKMESASPENWITIGAVQPNLPLRAAPDREPSRDALRNDFGSAMQQAKELADQHPEMDLIAFPENPDTFDFNTDGVRRSELGRLIRETGKPLILNVDAIEPGTARGAPARYNVALWVDAKRDVAGSYAKIKRVPIVEHLPGESVLPWIRNLFPRSFRVLPGDRPEVFETKPGVRIIPLICYEGTFSGFVRPFVKRGGNLIVNQVNDSWFLRTPASEVHLALTLFRTVEYRVPMVRVTNSGITAHIGADGRIVAGSKTRLFTKDATAFPLFIPPNRSVYAHVGTWWMLLLIPLVFATSRSGIRKRADR